MINRCYKLWSSNKYIELTSYQLDKFLNFWKEEKSRNFEELVHTINKSINSSYKIILIFIKALKALGLKGLKAKLHK